MASGYIPLPAPRIPRNAMIDVSGLSSAIDGYKTAERQNAMMAYRQGRDQVADQRADQQLGMQREGLDMRREQFNTQKAETALNRYAGIAQMISQAPPEQQPEMWSRAAPLYQSLRTSIPEFDQDAQMFGVDPNDPKAVGEFIMARQRGMQDPLKRREAEAGIGLKEAQAGYYRERPRTVAGGATTALVDRLMQENPDLTLAEAITIAKRGTGITEVGDELVDRNTGQTVRNVGGAIAGGKEAEVEGKGRAELRAALPKLELGYQNFINKSDRLVDVIDRAISRVGPDTTGYSAVLQNLPATDARALSRDLDTIRANVGFEELQAMRDASPTGGALGQVSEMENRLLQSIRGAMDQYDKGENLSKNLKIIRDSVTQLKALKAEQLAAERARLNGSSGGQPTGGDWREVAPGVRMRVKP
jgi:hypothetical protein